MGATPFAEQTQTELQATGVTVAAAQPGNPALTAREHQIASMAAAGYTDRRSRTTCSSPRTPSSTA